MYIELTEIPARDEDTVLVKNAANSVDLMVGILSDGLDHPELWMVIPDFVANNPLIVWELQERLATPNDALTEMTLQVLLGIAGAARHTPQPIIDAMATLAADYSQSPLVQGALFHLRSLTDPDNPKYRLAGKVCPTPFEQMDVLEGSSHLCCASWLSTSAGNLATTDWNEVWNSNAAQAIRASIHDGSYRYCNKGACPEIQANTLTPVEEMAAQSPFWKKIAIEQVTYVPVGPKIVNLAYDRTCNLSCPSCRTERYAADDAMRISYAEMQEKNILPLLKNASETMITGSGDPFASKNFRQLMLDLTPEEYPNLRFRIMTNGMLFNHRQWNSFPNLHGRVKILKISTDAATGPTHELLRRGARWPVMLENMAFAGELTSAGEIEDFEIVCTVQEDNYHEMGDIVDLAHHVGATRVYFARITNWGTFSAEQYRRKAVFITSHIDHHKFLIQMQDSRLRDPIVFLGDLEEFVYR